MLNNIQLSQQLIQIPSYSGVNKEVIEFLNKNLIEGNINKLISFPLNGDFANFKNHLNQNCIGEFIYQLDADELIDSKFLKSLPKILENNKDRLDSITPMVQLLSDLDIRYYKESKCILDNNIVWCVYSIFEENGRPDIESAKLEIVS